MSSVPIATGSWQRTRSWYRVDCSIRGQKPVPDTARRGTIREQTQRSAAVRILNTTLHGASTGCFTIRAKSDVSGASPLPRVLKPEGGAAQLGLPGAA